MLDVFSLFGTDDKANVTSIAADVIYKKLEILITTWQAMVKSIKLIA